MNIAGQQTYAAGREVLWALLHDPVVLPHLLPGCQSLVATSTDQYHGAITIRIGQVMETLEGDLLLEPGAPPRSFSFHAEGRNPDGALRCRGRIALQAEGPDATTLTYEAEFETDGRPAQVSSRMHQTIAQSFARRSLEALQKQVDIRTRVYTTTTDRQPAPSTSLSMPAVERLVMRRRAVAVVVMALSLLLVRKRLDRRRARS
ncbi:MAG: hypothetical protein KC410_04195 [Anaerolineales bacterium]|nr:hypothetical protein [Anaerolineales bacterium]MCB8934259.1 hypothetical protein [Promineifilum sp.]